MFCARFQRQEALIQLIASGAGGAFPSLHPRLKVDIFVAIQVGLSVATDLHCGRGSIDRVAEEDACRMTDAFFVDVATRVENQPSGVW